MPEITRSVESLYSCQLTSENWWKNDTDWWGCPASHLAMQHLRASSSLKQMTQYFFSYVKQLPLYINNTSTTHFEGKKEAEKKRTKKWRNRAKEYILLIIIQWSAYKKIPACKLGAAVGFERRHGVRWNGGGRAVYFPVPIGSSTLSTDHTDNFLSDVHEPIIAWKDTAQKQEYWLKFEVPSGSNFCEKPTVATTISITGSCNKEHVRGSSWFFGSMTKLQ